jgi:hypothetical protein
MQTADVHCQGHRDGSEQGWEKGVDKLAYTHVDELPANQKAQGEEEAEIGQEEGDDHALDAPSRPHGGGDTVNDDCGQIQGEAPIRLALGEQQGPDRIAQAPQEPQEAENLEDAGIRCLPQEAGGLSSRP